MTLASSTSPHNEAMPKLSAIILAAGYSSRMGKFNPLLPIGDRAALEWVMQLFRDSGVPDVSVVAGHRAEELQKVIEAAGARCVLNPHFVQGMFSSVRAGVAALPSGTQACFIIPVDIPLVRPGTVRYLARACAEQFCDVVYPVLNERRGHPPLTSQKIFTEILNAGPDANLSRVLAAHENDAANVFVPDEAIHMDMDTPEDLARIRELAPHGDVPTPNECEALLAMYQPAELVVRHSRVVARVAYAIALALVGKNPVIDPQMVRAGAILNDIAKGSAEHAEVGAEILRQFEFGRVAQLVALHTDYSLEPPGLTDAAIVYLADKLVSGEQVVGLSQRFWPVVGTVPRSPGRAGRSPASACHGRVDSHGD